MVTTGDMPTTRRSTQKMPTEETRVTAEVPAIAAAPAVSANRRMRGTLIALVFLVLFLAIAGWWVFRASEAVAPRHGGTAAPTDSRP
jgi:hypothetical protein